MENITPIRTALISVYHKEGLEPVLEALYNAGVRFLSTGGTGEYIESLGYPCGRVEDVTGYPSILGGRVKTLHPLIFGGILSRRDRVDDRADVAKYNIASIDLVLVDLYPFEKTVEEGGTCEEIIEKIDIGGISLIRAAAKNYKDVAIVASRSEYGELLDIVKKQGANTTEKQRHELATKAFSVTSHYDTAIHQWFELNNK